MSKYHYSLPGLFFFLYCGLKVLSINSISIDSTPPNRIAMSFYFIPTVSFNRIYIPLTHTLHNPYMVNSAILAPIKENNIPRRWNITAILKLPLILKPFYTIRTKGKFRQDTTRQITTLIRTP